MTDTKEQHLFIVSTPLHLLVSLAIVAEDSVANAHLIFIDQVVGKQNHYLDVLESWSDNPFKSIQVFYRSTSRFYKKTSDRAQIFSKLADVMQQIRPAHIYVGNDRRIEFQWCMHQCDLLGYKPTAYYLDEGTFTYVGRKASQSFSDRIVDNFLKKLVYGWWFKHPDTVGASDWIDIVYASYPDIVHPLLKNKVLRKLSLEYWQSESLVKYCSLLNDHISPGLQLGNYDVVVTLPHESVINSNPDYQQAIQSVVNDYIQEGKVVGVKYHPRDSKKDVLGLAQLDGVSLLPAAIPFESMLPMLKVGSQVVGDFSTALITTRLLRPDVEALAIDHGKKNDREEFVSLYRLIGVQIK